MKIKLLSVVTVAALTAVACSGDSGGEQKTHNADHTQISTPPDPSEYQPPESVQDITVVWSTAPDIDIHDDRSRLVRGTLESIWIVNFAGLEYTYPGFIEAMGPDLTSEMKLEGGLRDGTPLEGSGTPMAHILRFDETDDGFTTLYCTLNSKLGTKYNTPQYRVQKMPARAHQMTFSRELPSSSIEPARYTSTRQPPDSQDDNERPTWQAPRENLFTGWTVENEWAAQEGKDECEQWGYSADPDLIPGDREAHFVDEPPQPLPAYPGW